MLSPPDGQWSGEACALFLAADGNDNDNKNFDIGMTKQSAGLTFSAGTRDRLTQSDSFRKPIKGYSLPDTMPPGLDYVWRAGVDPTAWVCRSPPKVGPIVGPGFCSGGSSGRRGEWVQVVSKA